MSHNLFSLTIIYLLGLPFLAAQLDTIRDYSEKFSQIDGQLYDPIIARLDLQGKVMISGYDLKVACASQCTFDVDLYAQEGGLPDPLSHIKLAPTQSKSVSKTDSSSEVIYDKPLLLDSDHYFIHISNITGPLKLITDRHKGAPSCESQDGGTYSPILYYDKNQRLYQSYFRMKVDQYLEKDTSYSEVQFKDITRSILGPRPYKGFAVSCGDISGDGRLDLLIDRYLLAGVEKGRYKEITRQFKLPVQKTNLKHIMLDFENDGDLDILFFRGMTIMQYYNLGDRKIKRQTLQLPKMQQLSSIAYADVSGNGLLDVFVTQQWEHYPKPAPNYFLMNMGKTLVDKTKLFYPDHQGTKNFSNRLSCDTMDLENTCVFDMNKNTRTKEAQFSDLDDDGDLDLYLTNYFLEQDVYYEAQTLLKPAVEERVGDPIFLKKELSDHNLHKMVNEKGNYLPAHDMEPEEVRGHHGTGLELVDLDNDLDVDILVSQLAHPKYLLDYGHRPTSFYLNEGNGTFKSQADSGLAYEETHSTIITGDVNNDGLIDVYLAAYYGCRYADLYMQNSDGSFVNVANDCGLARMQAWDDAAFVDLDGDGKLDLLTRVDGLFKVFKNTSSDSNNWVSIKLIDTKGNRDGVGAKVIVHTSGGSSMKEMGLSKGKLYQPPHQVHFGLGKNRLKKVKVIWPDGEEQVYKKIEQNRLIELSRHD